MSLLDKVKLNQRLPFSEDYQEEMATREFLEVSYDANGMEYTCGSAPDGKIINKMECEEPQDYLIRCKVTPTRSYVSSILNKYNASVFRNEPQRDSRGNNILEQLFSNSDGYGTHINELMKSSLLSSQKFESCFLLADSTATDTQVMTIAQKTASNSFPYIRKIESSSVVDYEEIEDTLIEAIILLSDENGLTFARWMNNSDYIDIQLEQKQLRVTSIGDPYAHGYSNIPLKEIEPFSSAQAEPISHSQRTIVNTLSLLQQEMNDSVFTKWILSGTRLPDDANGVTGKVSWSGKRMVVLESESAKLSLLGADHGSADSLRKQIDLEETNMYRSAGLNNPNVDPTNISGYALRINQDAFFTICSKLKATIEYAENYILQLICEKEGIEFAPSIYSDRYVADDDSTALIALRDQLALALPATLKRLLVSNYVDTFYNLKEEDKAQMEQELLSMYISQPAVV